MNADPELPWARLVLLSLGSGVGVLALAVVVLAVLRPGPVLALLVALAGLVGCVAAAALVARRVTAGVLRRADEAAVAPR